MVKRRSSYPEQAACLVWADSFGKVIYVTIGSEDVIGWTPAELIGQPIVVFVPDAYRILHQTKFEETVKTGVSPAAGQRRALHALGRDGLERPINLTLCALDAVPKLFVAVIEHRGL